MVGLEQDRTRRGRFRKAAGPGQRLEHGPNAHAQGPAMSRFPTGAATPASTVDALKAVAGDPPKVRASFAKGRFVRGTDVPSDRAEEITKSRRVS